MTKTRIAKSRFAMRALLVGASVIAPFGLAHAWQSSRYSTVVAPPPSVRAQQNVQQQQTRNQVQQSQLQQQLHQSVSDNARQPNANNPQAQRQSQQADQARQDRERAAEQDALDRQRAASELPRVVPQNRPPAANSGG
jgi:hypothetical protein